MTDHSKLVVELKNRARIREMYEKDLGLVVYDSKLMNQAAAAIEELQDLVNRSVCFFDSAELAESLRSLNPIMPPKDIDWHMQHKAMGFADPIADCIEALVHSGEESNGGA